MAYSTALVILCTASYWGTKSNKNDKKKKKKKH
jgi:hypothetical protein